MKKYKVLVETKNNIFIYPTKSLKVAERIAKCKLWKYAKIYNSEECDIEIYDGYIYITRVEA